MAEQSFEFPSDQKAKHMTEEMKKSVAEVLISLRGEILTMWENLKKHYSPEGEQAFMDKINEFGESLMMRATRYALKYIDQSKTFLDPYYACMQEAIQASSGEGFLNSKNHIFYRGAYEDMDVL